MSNDPDPRIVVLTAPSGSGKTTIAHALLRAFPDMRFSVSATTRDPRPGEEDGVHYHFLSREAFDAAVREERMVEYQEVYPGCLYGTLRSEADRSSAARPLLLDIDVIGASNVKKIYGDRALVIFISPPSMDTLIDRLRGRRTETENEFAMRLERMKMELAYEDRFDAKVVNNMLEDAVEETVKIVSEFLRGEHP